MKKNRMMRLASILLVCVLLTTSVISGTFAKYTTSVDAHDTARVATWGFNGVDADIAITDLFKTAYTQGSGDSNVLGYADIIAPGTTNSASFQFKYNGQEVAPEVDYNFTVSVKDSTIGANIKSNPNIQWRLNHTVNGTTEEGSWGNWDTLMGDILSLSGTETSFDGTNYTITKYYEAKNLPTAFSANDDTYTIEWQWIFEKDADSDSSVDDENEFDTNMGNADTLETVAIYITITATQVD